jgi:aspartate 1-decarboxylase
MLSVVLKSKLHNARITQSEPDYEGSLSIDEDLMDAVGLAPHEKILVANRENGNRFETYVIPAPRGSGTIGLNGPATHQGNVGDRVIVLSFGLVSPEELRAHRPLVLVLDARNRPVGKPREL